MRVYHYLDAQEHAQMWMEVLSNEELEGSVYRKVDIEIPDCIKRHSKRLNYAKARAFLRQARPRAAVARQLIRHTLEMDACGQGHEHAWPGHLIEKDVPGISDWLMDAESSRPGCLITWYEGDAINACFDEDAQHMGENGACQPNVAIPIHLGRPPEKLDENVKMAYKSIDAVMEAQRDLVDVVHTLRLVVCVKG